VRALLLDLFCCEGGASAGYAAAGFDVIGADNDARALRRYPWPSYHGDWRAGLAWALDSYDIAAIHASPPCQAYSTTRNMAGTGGAEKFPALVPDVRQALQATGLPYVIENVPGAPMPDAVMLCGRAYGLRSARHRLFESSTWIMSAGCACGRDAGIPICGHGVPSSYRARTGHSPKLAERKAAIGAPAWMSREGLRESIPPAYTQHIGEQLLAHLAAGTAA
jgi:DNA (cytosine-5)-methyltransferase 1